MNAGFDWPPGIAVLDSRFMALAMSYNPIFVILSSEKPFILTGLKMS